MKEYKEVRWFRDKKSLHVIAVVGEDGENYVARNIYNFTETFKVKKDLLEEIKSDGSALKKAARFIKENGDCPK